MKTWAVSQIRYGAVTVKWAKNNLGKVDYVIGDYVKNLEGAIQKYDHELDGIIERKVCKTLLDFTIQCNIKTEAQ